MSKTKQGTEFNHGLLRSILAERRISNIELAKSLGKTPTTISNWKTGFSRPRWSDLSLLAKALKIDFKTLL